MGFTRFPDEASHHPSLPTDYRGNRPSFIYIYHLTPHFISPCFTSFQFQITPINFHNPIYKVKFSLLLFIKYHLIFVQFLFLHCMSASYGSFAHLSFILCGLLVDLCVFVLKNEYVDLIFHHP